MSKLKHFTINTLFYMMCFILAQPIVLIAFIPCVFENQFYTRYFFGFSNDRQKLKDDNKRLIEENYKLRRAIDNLKHVSGSL
jgi:hypothetical protein